jgi:repressor LexA
MVQISNDATKIYEYISDCITSSGKAPTIREIAQITGFSVRKSLYILRELEDALIVKRSPYRSRAIEIISPLDIATGKVSDAVVQIPIVGTAPGSPFIMAEENIEDYLSVPTRLIKGKTNVFLLRVVGNSMSPFLEEGDLAIVKPQDHAETRDVVVAVREGSGSEYEATIKEFHKQGNQIILNPLNTKEFSPLMGDLDSIKIQGIVVGAIKLFRD